MELVNRHRFTDMLRTLVDVTTERLVYGKMTNPFIFDGWITQYRNRDDRLLAEIFHTENGSVYHIDLEWEQNHNTDFACPPHSNNIELGMDSRGWIFTVIRNTENYYPESESIRILAGCRNFSLEKAKQHWKDNPEVYPRILMAEMIAANRGWIKGVYLTPDYKLAHREDHDPEVEPTLAEIKHREKLMHDSANPER